MKLVIVRDMWLTGFDAPCMHTMYIDKPMQGHGLMQAIARVNRVFRDKPGGLVVDYIGIAQNLRKALADYSPSDQERTGIDEEAAVAKMRECFERVKAVFHGFDYVTGLSGPPQQRLETLACAIDWVLRWQEAEAAKKTGDEDKKRAHRAYQDMVLELTKAYALSASSDEAAAIRDEVGFFQTVKAAIVKSTASGGLGKAERVLAVQQLVSRAMASSEIVDILKAAGITSPDISILSEEFLAEIQEMPRKNLALEALKKLLNGEIQSRSKSNVVEARKFSARLEAAVARYHVNAISAVELLNELIAMAKDIQASSARGEELGLSLEEVAFYEALAENESAVQAMGDEKLRVIAHELLESLRKNASVDWAKRESARRQHAGAGQAHPEEIRLSAGFVGSCGADGIGTGGEAVAGDCLSDDGRGVSDGRQRRSWRG